MALPSYDKFKDNLLRRYADLDEEEIKRLYDRAAKATHEPAPEPAPEAAPPPVSPGAEFARGAVRGFANYGIKTLGGLMEFLGADQAGGGVADFGRQVAEDFARSPQSEGDVVTDPLGTLSNPNWWMAGLGEQVTPLAEAFLTRGIGQRLRAGRVAQGVAQAGVAGLGETMPEFSDYLKEGMDPDEARMRAMISTVAVGGLNALPLDMMFNSPASPVRKALMTAGTEAVTEWAEEPVQALAWGRDPIEAMKQGLNVMPIAALTGGGMSMANDLMTPSATNADRRQAVIQQMLQQMPAREEVLPSLQTFQDGSQTQDVMYHGVRGGDRRVRELRGEPEDFTEFDPMRGEFGIHVGNARQASQAATYAVAWKDGEIVLPTQDAYAEDDAGRPIKVDTQPLARDGARVMPVRVRATNPLRMPDIRQWNDPSAWLTAARGMDGDVYRKIANLAEPFARAMREDLSVPRETKIKDAFKRRMMELIKKSGYDSVVYDNQYESRGESYILFDSGQVKSAISNSGDYDYSNPNILLNEKLSKNAERYSAMAEAVRRLARFRGNYSSPQATRELADIAIMSENLHNELGEDRIAAMEFPAGFADSLYGEDTASDVDAQALIDNSNEAGGLIALSSGGVPVNPVMLTPLSHVIGGAKKLGMPRFATVELTRAIVDPNPGSNMIMGYAPASGSLWLSQETMAEFRRLEENADADVGLSRIAAIESFIHEVGHAIDFSVRPAPRVTDRGPRAGTSASPLFYFENLTADADGNLVAENTGPVMREAIDTYNGDTALRHHFTYPFARYWMPDHMLKAEVFAQLHALFYLQPKLMKREMPSAYKLIKEINDAGRRAKNVDKYRSRVRELLQVGVAPESAAQASVRAGETDRLAVEVDARREAVPARSTRRAAVIAAPLRNKDGSWRSNANGDITGAPPGIKTNEDIKRLVTDVVAMLNDPTAHADPGNPQSSLYWYDRSANEVMRLTKGDPAMTERVLRLLSFFSANNQVGGNTTAMIHAVHQIARGEDIRAGRFPNVAQDLIGPILAAKEFDTKVKGVEQKMMSFYNNLKAAAFKEYPSADATIDMWMARLYGYPNDSVQGAKYRFANMVTQLATDQFNKQQGTDLKPYQIQAALWTYAKNNGYQEGGSVGAAKKTTEYTSAVDFSTYMKRAEQHITAEQVPSTSTEFGARIAALPYAVRAAYSREASKVTHDADGKDLVLEAIGGVPLFAQGESVGTFEGTASPNTVTSIVAQQQTEGGKRTYAHDNADLYALAQMYIHSQDGVPWFRLDPTVTPGKAAEGTSVVKGVMIAFRGPQSVEQIEQLYEHVRKRVPGFELTMVGNDAVAMNFTGMTDRKFYDAVEKALSTYDNRDSIVEFVDGIKAESAYHDVTKYSPSGWKDEQKAVEALEAAIRDRGREDLLPQLRAWRARVRGLQGQAGELTLASERTTDLIPKQADIGNLSARPTAEIGTLTPGEQEMMRGVARMFPKSVNRARRGTLSLPELDAMADALGMSAADLAERTNGSAWNAEEIRAATKIVKDQARKVLELKEAAKIGGPNERARFLGAFLELAEIQAPFHGIAAEAGRALGAFRSAMQGVQTITEMAESLGEYQGDIDAMIAGLEGIDESNASAVTRNVREMMSPTWSDKFLEYWLASLLTNPTTQIVNLGSNALVDAFSVVEHKIGSIISGVRGDDAISAEDVKYRTQYMMQGAAKGMHEAAHTFKTEEEYGASKIDLRRRGAIEGTKGKIIRLPFRALSAGDSFFKVVAEQGALAEMASRTGRKMGLKGAELDAYVKDQVEHPSDSFRRKAMADANYYTFTNRLGPIGQAVQRAANEVPLLRLVFPFIRTPANIVKFAAERTPFGLLMHNVRQNLKGVNGKVAQDMQIARLATGTGVMLFFAVLADMGRMTGGGPDDPRERQLLYQTGWQPYSIRVGDTWYSYGRLEPLGMLLGISADMVEIAKASVDPERMDQVAAMTLTALSKNVTSKTYLRGLSELTQMLADPDRYGERYFMNLAGTVVPSGVAAVERVVDPELRYARDILDQIKGRTPGLSDQLPSRVDYWGRDIEMDNQGALSLVNPIYTSPVESDPLAREFLRLGYTRGTAGKYIGKVRLPDAVHAEYQRMIGEQMKRVLEPMVMSPRWQTIPDWKKEEIFDDVLREIRKSAKSRLLMAHPEILEEDARIRRDARAG